MAVFLDALYVVLKQAIRLQQVLRADYHYYLEEIEDRPEEGNRKWWSSGGAFTAINKANAGIFVFSNTLGYTTANEPMIKGSPHDHNIGIIIERLIYFQMVVQQAMLTTSPHLLSMEVNRT